MSTVIYVGAVNLNRPSVESVMIIAVVPRNTSKAHRKQQGPFLRLPGGRGGQIVCAVSSSPRELQEETLPLAWNPPPFVLPAKSHVPNESDLHFASF